jgi:aspartate aminotransferase
VTEAKRIQKAPGRVSSRVSAISESATLRIDALAKALRVAGEDVISFGAGEPDFPTPEHIIEAARRACSDPRSHHYSPTAGLPELREAIAAKTKRDSGYDADASQVLVTNGAKQAIYNALAALLDPGDEVLVPAPYWVTYPEAIKLAGGVPVCIPTRSSERFRVTIDQLEASCSDRTKVMLVVSPCNPTGTVYSKEELEEIGGWADARGLWMVTDEIYEHLVYGHHVFHSLPVLVPSLAERCVIVNGVAKTYAMTGWRVGWMIGPSDVVAAATNLQSHSTSNVANVSQLAALAAVTGDLEAIATMRDAFDRRRQTLWKLLSEIPDVECAEPEGTFYAFPSFEGILGREIRGHRPKSGLELAELILSEARVAIVPGEPFGGPGHARLSYALADDDLVEGITRIAHLLGESTA